METLFRKVFTKDRLPEENDTVVMTSTFRTTGNYLYSLKRRGLDKEIPEWWLEPIAPNRERAIEIADKAVGTYSNDLTKSIASSVIDALINEGLLLGKSVNEEMLEALKVINEDGYYDGEIGKQVKQAIKNAENAKSLSSSIVSEEEIEEEFNKVYNKEFPNRPLNDILRWSMCMVFFKAALSNKSLSSSIVYPSDGQLKEFLKNCDPLNQTLEKQADLRMGFLKAIELIKSLNSSRESEPSIENTTLSANEIRRKSEIIAGNYNPTTNSDKLRDMISELHELWYLNTIKHK